MFFIRKKYFCLNLGEKNFYTKRDFTQIAIISKCVFQASRDRFLRHVRGLEHTKCPFPTQKKSIKRRFSHKKKGLFERQKTSIFKDF